LPHDDPRAELQTGVFLWKPSLEPAYTVKRSAMGIQHASKLRDSFVFFVTEIKANAKLVKEMNAKQPHGN
jgi:hypothetical protein